MSRDKIIKRINKIKYSVFSPKDILRLSVVKVITPELYDKYGFPVEGGLMDLKMGVIEPGLRCKTCGKNYKKCEGHFGHLEFARPILNITFIDEIHKILNLTCRKCYRVLLSDEKIEYYKKKFEEAKKEMNSEQYNKLYKKFYSEVSKIKTCPHCGAKQEKITLNKASVFEFREGDSRRLLPTEIRYRFENIPEKDLPLLDLNDSIRPEWLIMTNFLVPPVSMRSSITLESGLRSEDDLTHKLSEIIRANQKLQEHLLVGVPEAIVETVWDLLQYHVSTYMNNNIAGLAPARHRSGEPLKSIVERLVGKKGIIRNNLIGKRVNFSARTVISPDPKLKLNEIGVPERVAMTLTVPETVNENNIDFLRKLVKNGSQKYPGANYIYTIDGKKKIITEEIKETLAEELEYGYTVERHLVNGDSVVFNRQPSLHKLSMMGHVVKVLPNLTFAINPGVCEPYNADFDGDEMNLHVPQTLEARQEVERLLDVKNHLISPASGESVIGCIQDSITGIYVLTRGAKFSKEDAYELLFEIGYEGIENVEFSNEPVDGKEIFSIILPDDLNFIGESKSGRVVIEKGKLVEGIVDKKLIGSGGGTLLRHLHKHYGPEKTLMIIKYIFNLGIQTLRKTGLTISMTDFELPKEAEDKIEGITKEAYDEFSRLYKSYKRGDLEKITGLTLEDSFEIKTLQVLNSIRDKSIKIITKYINNETGTMLMANSGARGNLLAVAQMHAAVGQQALRGRRISRGFYGRTMSFFKKEDLSPEARGYIKSPLRKGLKPYEVFFGAITGRDGLMDTALRTPKSGYLYRRMSTAMLDLLVKKDLSVRDETGNVVQFKYGDDGVDVSKTVGGSIDVKSIVENTLRRKS